MRNVLLVGMGITTATALRSLVARCRVVGVVRNVDPERGPVDPVRRYAEEHDIPVFRDASIAGLSAAIDRLRPDCVVISSFDRILPPELIARCPFINVHYAPLPRYRGRANVNWAIINGEPVTAITIHNVAEGLDNGDILFQRLVPIGGDDTVGDLYERLNALQLEHLGGTVARFLDGVEPGAAQLEASATYGCTRLLEDGEIDWSASTASIDALIRGLSTPYPGAFTHLAGRRLIVWRARAVDRPPAYEGRVAGRVVAICREQGTVDVLTGDGILRLSDVETEASGLAPAASVIRSIRATLGLNPLDLLTRIEALERELGALRVRIPATGEHNVLV
jgi:methionyl-tRNA formyltransferase